MKKKRSVFDKIFITIFFIILTIYAFSMVILLLWGFITSLKSNLDFQTLGNILGLPSMEYSREELTHFLNYQKILEGFHFKESVPFFIGDRLVVHNSDNNFFSLILNTFIYSGIGCLIPAFVSALAGYLCAKYKNRLSKVIYIICLFVMATPIVGNQAAMITVLRNTGLYDTWIGDFCMKFNFTGMYFFVFFAFYESVTDAYAEAAEIDGASQFKVMMQIYLPLSFKMITTVMLILFVTFWNDYQTPLLYLPTKPTLSYGVYWMVALNGYGPLSKVPTKVAACMILALPVLVIFLFLKEKLMGNISLGGVKE